MNTISRKMNNARQDNQLGDTEVDHNDGQFFRAMEWLMFFRPPLPSMVFQWF